MFRKSALSVCTPAQVRRTIASVLALQELAKVPITVHLYGTIYDCRIACDLWLSREIQNLFARVRERSRATKSSPLFSMIVRRAAISSSRDSSMKSRARNCNLYHFVHNARIIAIFSCRLILRERYAGRMHAQFPISQTYVLAHRKQSACQLRIYDLVP